MRQVRRGLAWLDHGRRPLVQHPQFRNQAEGSREHPFLIRISFAEVQNPMLYTPWR
jgi:hypothetical protein